MKERARNPGRGAGGARDGALVAEYVGVPDLGRFRILPTATGGAVIYDETLPLGARTVGGETHKTKDDAIAAARAILAKEAETRDKQDGDGGTAQLGDG